MKMKGKISIAIATASVIFSLFSLTCGTYAWFSANRNVHSSNIEMKIDASSDIHVVSTTVYGWDSDEDQAIITENMELEPYDAFIIERNSIYNRRFLKVELEYPRGLPIDKKLGVEIVATEELYDGEFVTKNISNLIQFKYYDNTFTKAIDTTDALTTFTTASTIFDDKTMATDKFVTLADGGASADKEMVIDNDSIMTFSSTLEEGYRTELFVEYRYNDDLVEYFKNHTDEEFDIKVFEGKNVIEFNGDVSGLFFDLFD